MSTNRFTVTITFLVSLFYLKQLTHNKKVSVRIRAYSADRKKNSMIENFLQANFEANIYLTAI
jgi:hypothetical protein